MSEQADAPGGLTRLEVPARGFRKPMSYILLTGMVFLVGGLVGLWLMATIPVIPKHGPRIPQQAPLWFISLFVPVPVIGLLLMIWSIQSALQRVTLGVDAAELLVQTRGLLLRQRRWRRQDVADLDLQVRRGGSAAFDLVSLVLVLQNGRRVTLAQRYGSEEMGRLRDAARVLLWPKRSGVLAGPGGGAAASG